jgi:tetratricopeptide (TPR) repeat protein
VSELPRHDPPVRLRLRVTQPDRCTLLRMVDDDGDLQIPLPLRNALEAGTAVLFVGSGIGAHGRDSKGQSGPTGEALGQELAEAFHIPYQGQADLARIAQVVELRKGRRELYAFLSERLADLEPDDYLMWLFSLRWKAIFTTNYDRLIERTYELLPTPSQQPVPMSSSSGVVPFNSGLDVPIYHLHGALFGEAEPRILITLTDYANFRERRRMLFELLKSSFATAPFLYLGYSHADPNWRMVLNELQTEFAPSDPPPSYRVARDTDPLDIEILAAQGVHTLTASIAEFADEVRRQLGPIRVDSTALTRMEERVPQDLLDVFRTTPAPVIRLLNSWTYVNQAPFHERPNTEAFLKGDIANWGTIAQGVPFERDVEESIFDDVVDVVTSPDPLQRAFLVLAPAGYGVTTLLMTLAGRLASERAGPIFFLKSGRQVLEGDIEFASSLSERAAIFIVDNAADREPMLANAMQRLKETRRHVCFLVGERLNEWRQRPTRFRAGQYAIEPLSEGEIDRLLDCLQSQGALGHLADLGRDMQRGVIRKAHQKELLVAMRESTEGLGFDAIIEGEYWGIGNDTARRLYGTVCTLYRIKALARDALLSTVLGVGLAELYQETGDATEGVVIWECIDDELEIYAARARHHTIADVVWHRCLNDAEREHIQQTVLAALNLNYQVDVRAFEHLVRDDDAVDSIRGLDAKTRFFETAVKKDPLSPYVRQHYARMLRREHRLELALAEIERAMSIPDASVVVLHTKGVILSDLAIETESLAIARRRLAQAEQVFREAIAKTPRNEYAYHGLADLFVKWAKRIDLPEEEIRYLSKAEEIISLGLSRARNRASLWIVSADIQRWLGDTPAAMDALKRAVEASPGSVTARYLLARAHYSAGGIDEVVDLLAPLIEANPDDFRTCVLLARALHDQGEPLARTIALLQLSLTYGRRDPRYIATLGGMLFMHGQFTEAERVFEEARRREFSVEDASRIGFVPNAPGQSRVPMTLEGRVTHVSAGFCFIECPGYPAFFCPGSKYRGLLMERGLPVRFHPGFNTRGAVADVIPGDA